MRQTPWWLLWLLPLACEEAIERPAPLTLAASGAVQPRHACPTQVVEVRGGGFSPAIAPNDDDALEISLPTLRLEGAAGRYEVDPVKGSALRWRSDEEMALSLPQDMTTGVYDLTLSAPGADPAA
ncbi:hypothetical protein KKB55_15430 [Myxococcota bacterium]|nr:hypothetical protein [Myxococcota bacterium]